MLVSPVPEVPIAPYTKPKTFMFLKSAMSCGYCGVKTRQYRVEYIQVLSSESNLLRSVAGKMTLVEITVLAS